MSVSVTVADITEVDVSRVDEERGVITLNGEVSIVVPNSQIEDFIGDLTDYLQRLSKSASTDK